VTNISKLELLAKNTAHLAQRHHCYGTLRQWEMRVKASRLFPGTLADVALTLAEKAAANSTEDIMADIGIRDPKEVQS
jgi:hypothetical protein